MRDTTIPHPAPRKAPSSIVVVGLVGAAVASAVLALISPLFLALSVVLIPCTALALRRSHTATGRVMLWIAVVLLNLTILLSIAIILSLGITRDGFVGSLLP